MARTAHTGNTPLETKKGPPRKIRAEGPAIENASIVVRKRYSRRRKIERLGVTTVASLLIDSGIGVRV